MADSATLPLLFETGEDVVKGVTTVHDYPAKRFNTGSWKSSIYIIGAEVAERFAYYAILLNLITYLTDYLAEDTATASKNVNIWSGVACVVPLLGAFVADSYLGRYKTIILSSVIYLLGLVMLTLSAVLPWLRPDGCWNAAKGRLMECWGSSSRYGVAFFFLSLYLVAIGEGGHIPSLYASLRS
ncbi:hypothetical protein AMTR_s00118p00123330 [Amborella trichopoda]|uniref:Uncharacterized protein n=1 Tax=Amborella trichopoda TaxID=13333 RepID=W1NNZ4_AMBTC|nr:hypothetical protein AMTR_s00118p00123330 [Amborella trichopoda]